MRRRDFIAGLGGSAVWPRAARTQQQGLPVVGFLHFWASPNPSSRWLLEFRQGLADTGYVAGWNVAIEYRGANGQSAQLPALASELVRRDVNLATWAQAKFPVRLSRGGASLSPSSA